MDSAAQSPDTHLEQGQIKTQLAQIYTPSVPITDPKLFSGRAELLEALRNKLVIPGTVFILYGERGVGKTSFYNVLLHELNFVKYSCTAKDSFITIFLNILRSLGEHLTETEISNLEEAGFEIGAEKIIKATATGKASLEEKFAPILPEPLDQASIIRRLKKVQGKVDAIVFDEFQNLVDLNIHAQMNDLVKALSDEEIKVRIIFVGIAESDEILLPPSKAYMEYKMRHFEARKIPRMTIDELEDIIDRRKHIFGVQFLPEVKTELAKIANGYPSVAHTLALNSCFAWLTLNAARLVRNWFVKNFGRLFGANELKVEKIKMEIGEQEFASGVQLFLTSFHNNYETQTKQFRSGLSATNFELLQKILLLLAGCEDGMSETEMAKALGISKDDLMKALLPYPSLIVQDEKTTNCRLAFSHLGTVIRAYDYLRRSRPEQFTRFLNSSSPSAKRSLPRVN